MVKSNRQGASFRDGAREAVGIAARLSTLVVATLVGAALVCASQVARAQAALDEYAVKAGVLVNFAKFVEWPETAFASRETPFVLCVAGRDPFGGALAALEGRPVQNRDLRVRRGVTADEIAGCHMLFIPETEERRVPLYLRSAGNQPVLLVGDGEGFVEAGGAVGLVMVDSRIKFDVNLPSASRGGLRPPSQLLRLARSVVGAPRK